MTGSDKKLIYNLLKTASSAYYGFNSPDFKDEPDFSENAAKASRNNINQTESVNVSSEVFSSQNGSQDNTQGSSINTESITASQENFKAEGLTKEKLNEKIQLCSRCSLKEIRTGIEKGKGFEKPYVVIVSAVKKQKDLILSSQEEKLLIKMLNAIFLDPECNCYLTSIVKCRLKENDLVSRENYQACKTFFDAELHLLKPKFILFLGEEAVSVAFGNGGEAKVSNYRQKVLEYNKIPSLVTYSPETLLQHTEFKAQAWEDLKLLRNELDKISPEFKYSFIPRG